MANEQELIKAAELDSAVAAAVKRWQSVDMTYMPVYPGGQKQFDEDCQALAVKYMNSLASRKAEPVAITEECRLFAEVLREWWSFSDQQQHTHSWHTREDFIERELPKLLKSHRAEQVRGLSREVADLHKRLDAHVATLAALGIEVKE